MPRGMSQPQNLLHYGDNLDILRRYVDDESVDVICLDLPFQSNVAGPGDLQIYPMRSAWRCPDIRISCSPSCASRRTARNTGSRTQWTSWPSRWESQRKTNHSYCRAACRPG